MVVGCVEHGNEIKDHSELIPKENLYNTLNKFLEVENVYVVLTKSKEYATEHFARTHWIYNEGIYIYMVKRPLKKNPSCLGKSK